MKSKQLVGLLLLSFVGFSLPSHAQKDYSFEEILRLGLENSHQLKVSASKKSISELAVKSAKLNYAPNVSVSGQGMILNEPDIRLMGQQSSISAPKNVAFGMGSLTIPIFNGFQLKNNLKANQELLVAGNDQGNVDSTMVVVTIIDTYVSLFKAQKSQELLKQNISNAEKRVSDFDKLKQNGLLTENDLLKAQLQVSQLQLSLIDVQHQEELAQYNLNLLTGLSESTHFKVDSTIIFKVPTLISENGIEELMENRKDYQAITHQLNAAEYVYKIQKSGYYPHVNLTGMYASVYIPNILTATNVLNAGLSLSWDLSSFYKNNPVVAQKKESVYQANEQMMQLLDKIKFESHKGFLDFQQTQSKIELYEKMSVQAKENYRAVEGKFNNSLATTTDLLDANVQFLQAQINEELGQADVFLAYCNYLKVTGRLDELKSIN